jgi:hypothetical protein
LGGLVGRDGKIRSATGSITTQSGDQQIVDMDEREILKVAAEIRQRHTEERTRQQSEKEEQARVNLGGKRIWTVTDEAKVVRCDFLIADPPFGITNEPWEPDDVEGFNREWSRRWSSCGADFVANFWCQSKLSEGRKWFDESLNGYEFQQMHVWHYKNGSGPRSRSTLKSSWYPIFL